MFGNSSLATAGLWIDGPMFDVLYLICVIIALTNLMITSWLFVISRYARRTHPKPGDIPEDLMFVFVVPAFNEELVITDSIDRLLQLRAPNKLILVIDDGSTDSTPDILSDLAAAHSQLHVLTRRPPESAKGKAAALNAAWSYLSELRERFEPLHEFDEHHTVLSVVDADGRLEPHCLDTVGQYFLDDEVDAVQLEVRMYNRRQNLLTLMQDLEFSGYGELFQQARNLTGTVSMGGNAQFVRLDALADIADERGPWRDLLTEDLDLGIRLHLAGKICRYDSRTSVSQQAIPSLTRLVRQRARWYQGVLQNWGHANEIRRSGVITIKGKLDMLTMLSMLIWIIVMGVATVIFLVNIVHIFVMTYHLVPPWTGEKSWEMALFSYILCFGVLLLSGYAAWRGDKDRRFIPTLIQAHLYAFYVWIWTIAGVRAIARQLTGRRTWAKTERERIRALPDISEV